MGADGFALPANQWGPGVQGAEQRFLAWAQRQQEEPPAHLSYGCCWQKWAVVTGIGLPRTHVPAAPLVAPGPWIWVLSLFVCPLRDIQAEMGAWCWPSDYITAKGMIGEPTPTKEHLLRE